MSALRLLFSAVASLIETGAPHVAPPAAPTAKSVANYIKESDFSKRTQIGIDLSVCKIEKITHSNLYQAYEEWCRRNDEEPITKKVLTIELQGRDFVSKRGHAGKKIWHGLALKGYL